MKMIIDIKFHPLAELFPFIEGEEFDILVESIKNNGQREPIHTYEEQILDGRNRYMACKKLNIQPILVEYTGNDPIEFVIDENLNRRHLTTSQRGMIAADLANMKRYNEKDFGNLETAPNSGQFRKNEISQPKAAKLLNVGKDIVEKSVRLKKEAPPEIIESIRQGTMTVNKAINLVYHKDPVIEIKEISIENKIKETHDSLIRLAYRAAELSLTDCSGTPDPKIYGILRGYISEELKSAVKGARVAWTNLENYLLSIEKPEGGMS
jgi:ParB-like chromosome segregation protein Spo0J